MTVTDQRNMTACSINSSQRIELLDILRGFSLLGILLMNMAFFQSPLTTISLGVEGNESGIDYAIAWSLFVFAEGKFYTMFSLLFGIGFVIFYDRAKQKSNLPKWLFFRRIIVLGLIGVAHAVFVWAGDILFIYSIAGLFLLFFVRTSASRLWKWGLFFIALPVALLWLSAVSIHSSSQSSEEIQQYQIDVNEMQSSLSEVASFASEAYATGVYEKVTEARIEEFALIFSSEIVFTISTFLGLFLLGAALSRSGVFTSSEPQTKVYNKLLIWGGIPGISAALYASALPATEMILPTVNAALLYSLMQISSLGLCVAYMAFIALMFCRNKKQNCILKNMAPAGRMALTNYLLQSLCFTTLFYGYGFGLYGELGRFEMMLLALAFWLCQLTLSQWWLQYFNYGPFEWLWRLATYGRWQTFKKVRR
ncbi:uncharacterized protein DFO83_102199 [Idiomarina loihiensis]|nr:uncharacterized protein DFO83_102199 [Idiomarina loihiensis]TDP50072.1 uncharacterized protein DET58_102195 [Idiomarina loihiensis]TDS24576.1 uncharacterized protein DET62_102185 [Idiomarina sp. H2]